MFIDEARIRIKAGDGGNGCMAFRREKFVPKGGPSGGDGGHGGDVLMSSSLSHNTLVHFRFNPEHKAQRGGHGLGSNCSGYAGEPITLKVPVGTLLYDDETGELIHDFARPNETIVIARGGRGGRGNQHFATSTHQAPREHELGRAGEERNYRLELRLLCDAGLVGYPNVGKSTLISRISAARPKIADYPFTTLEPQLGVVSIGEWPHEESFVVADLPGLIEGAHSGAGLGMQFLKHIERTSLVIHLVDVSDASGRPDPVEDYKTIAAELESFGHGIENKPVIIVASKIEIANPEKLKKLKAFAKRTKKNFFELSAVTGEGIEEFKFEIARQVRKLRPATAPGKIVTPKVKKVAPPASGKLARPAPVKTKKKSAKRAVSPAKGTAKRSKAAIKKLAKASI